MKPRSPLRHRAELALYRAVAGLALRLADPSAARLGAALGRVVSIVAAARSRLLDRNLAAAMPELGVDQRRALARACWRNFGRVVVDYLRLGRVDPAEFRRHLRIEGAEHFAAARARGKGVFLLSAHLGNWEAGAIAAGLIAEPISIVVRPLDNPLLDAELARLRSRFGNTVVSKRLAAREMLRAMRAGGTVAILVDQKVMAHEAILVPFFGRLARTTPALATLALRTDAAVVPVFCRPEGDGTGSAYCLTFEPPIVASALPESDRSVEALTARFMAVTERAIRQRPELWLWMHDRWRGAVEMATKAASA